MTKISKGMLEPIIASKETSCEGRTLSTENVCWNIHLDQQKGEQVPMPPLGKSHGQLSKPCPKKESMNSHAPS